MIDVKEAFDAHYEATHDGYIAAVLTLAEVVQESVIEAAYTIRTSLVADNIPEENLADELACKLKTQKECITQPPGPESPDAENHKV